ncbi:MAG: transposase [Nitrososphaeraceae archaeon]
MVDQKGVPLSVVIITSANTHDMKATINTLDNVVVKRPSDKQNLCLDKGYDFLEVQRHLSKEGTCHVFVTEVKKKMMI